MPEITALTVEERVALAVRDVFAAENGRVEALIRQAVDNELRALVQAQLAGRGLVGPSKGPTTLEGPDRRRRSHGEATKAPAPTHDMSLCQVCDERPRQAGRTVCSRCRERAKRERRAQAVETDAEAPRPT